VWVEEGYVSDRTGASKGAYGRDELADESIVAVDALEWKEMTCLFVNIRID